MKCPEKYIKAYIFLFFLLTNGLSSNLKMFNTLAIYQIILHLNKITQCLKMTTFKIVFTLDVFFSAETTMHCKVTCILYKKQAHFSQLFCLQVRSVTP